MICAASSSASGVSASVGDVELAAAPAGPPVEQLRPRRPDDEQRNAGRPVGEVVDEVEQAVVRPVQVLEDEHERPLLGEPLEVAPPRREALSRGPRARRAARRRRAAAGAARTHARSSSASAVRRSRQSFSLGDSGGSFSWMPACAFTISPSAQKLTPSPYGSARPCRHHTRSGDASSARRALPRDATCRYRARRRASRAAARARGTPGRTRRRATSSSRCAPDERQQRPLLEIHAEPRTRLRPPPTPGPARLCLSPSTGSRSAYSITSRVAR